MAQFVIYSPGVHSLVFLARADSEEQALKMFLEHDWDYVEQPDGSYRHKTLVHDSREAAWNTYGIEQKPNGSYGNQDRQFPSLEEAEAAYGIEENNGIVTSHDITYPDLAAALRAVPWNAHRVEVAPVTIDPDAPFQPIFGSKDEWDYVEESPEEDVKKDIVLEHQWLSQRYERLGLLPEAVAELKKAMRLSAVPRDQAYYHGEIGSLLIFQMDKLASGVAHYERCLRLGGGGNPSQMHLQAAEVYRQLEQPAKALRHYKQIRLDDMYDKDLAQMEAGKAEMLLLQAKQKKRDAIHSLP